VLEKLIDLYHVLGMTCLDPLLVAINVLCVYAQRRDIFVGDFVSALIQCQATLFEMYKSTKSAFLKDDFFAFKNLCELNHEVIRMKWSQSEDEAGQHLTFIVGGEAIAAEHDGQPVSQQGWAEMVASVKSQCGGM
jgi:hypothetical protein